MFNLTPEQVRDVTVTLIALVLSIAVHEFGHAFVADRLGDRTPRLQGRVTLNPLAHADLFGTLIFPLLALFMNIGLLFGWGKPVQVNPVAFTRRLRMKTGHLLVAAAGPAMNVVLAVLVTVIYGVLIATRVMSPMAPIAQGIIDVIRLNWVLCFFNLIPCPPLDGGTVLAGLLPDRYQDITRFLQQYGKYILIALLVTGLARYFVAPAVWLTHLSLSVVFGSLMG